MEILQCQKHLNCQLHNFLKISVAFLHIFTMSCATCVWFLSYKPQMEPHLSVCFVTKYYAKNFHVKHKMIIYKYCQYIDSMYKRMCSMYYKLHFSLSSLCNLKRTVCGRSVGIVQQWDFVETVMKAFDLYYREFIGQFK